MLNIMPYLTDAGSSHLSIAGSSIMDGKIQISFERLGKLSDREMVREVSSIVNRGRFEFIRPIGKRWVVNADFFRKNYPEHDKYPDWFRGELSLELEFEYEEKDEPRYSFTNADIPTREQTRKSYKTFATILMTEEIIMEQAPMKIFLSHKGVDKKLVRRYKKALEVVGFEPWLDEDAMPAGTNLDRAILQGMQISCAAVFFITPNYVDDGYLAKEIDYAIHEEQVKTGRFKIIALVLEDESGKKGEVPPMLRRFVFQAPDHELTGFYEIIRGLPIQLGAPSWK